MKKIASIFIVLFLFSTSCYAANWNTYTNLSESDLALDDEFGVWDTSVGEFKNLLMSEMYIFSFTRTHEKLTSGSDTLTSADNGKTFTNAGASENVTFVVPECVAATEGWNGKFVLINTSYSITVDSHVNDTLDPIVDTAGDSVISTATRGAVLYVECFDMGSSVYNWIAYADELWTDND